jgi:hypothetical protein
MSASYAAMFGFGLVLLGSWAGWGAAIHRLLLRGVVADRAMQAGWGLAFTLVVGGLLNLTGQITPRAIQLFVATGFALLLWDSSRDRGRHRSKSRLSFPRLARRPLFAAAVGALGLGLALLYAASICSTRFNDHDDLQAYFVFPAKMIQTGSLGPDPFSERRMLSLGGMSFLHALVLSVADSKYLRIVDPGVPFLLSAALLASIARAARANEWEALLALLVFLLVPPPADNTTSCLTGLCLFLTLYLTLFLTLRRSGFAAPLRRRWFSSAVPVALLAAGLCSLKTTHLPATVLLVLAAYSIRVVGSRNRRAAVGEAVLAGALTLLFLAPWMVSLYRSNGTAFYPVLGRGFHGSADATYWQLGTELSIDRIVRLATSAVDLKVAPLLILGAAVLFRGDLGARPLLIGWALAAAASCVLLPIASGSVDARYRYSYAFLYAAIFTLAVFVFSRRRAAGSGPSVTRRSWLVGALAMAVVLVGHREALPSYAAGRVAAVRDALEASHNPYFMLRYVRRYARMQESIPPGATVLTRLQYPFLLDFARNPTFIADYPGGSSPPPGMPFFQGGDRLAEYLCRRPIRYLAYSYFLEAGFYDALFEERLRPETEPWLRQQARHTQDFQLNLAELGRSRKRVYDDGDVFVLDLATSSNGQPLGCVPW